MLTRSLSESSSDVTRQGLKKCANALAVSTRKGKEFTCLKYAQSAYLFYGLREKFANVDLAIYPESTDIHDAALCPNLASLTLIYYLCDICDGVLFSGVAQRTLRRSR
jgi:hypothetical protein